MATYIRLTHFKSSDEKEQEFFNPENRYKAKQEDFSKIPGSPIAYWVSDRVKEIFEDNDKVENIARSIQGMITGDNENLLRIWYEVSINSFRYTNYTDDTKKWVPYNKGGESRNWYGNHDYVVDWSKEGKNFTRNRSVNSDLYFKQYLSWTYLSSSSLAARYYPDGFLWDVHGSGAFPYEEKYIYLILGLLATKTGRYFLQILNPTMSFQVENILALPIVSSKIEIVKLVKQNINISKEEWDSRETSWDFAQNEILRIKNEELRIENGKLEDVYNRYCEYWREKFFTLHQNEEELNRLFIGIYELQDELTPEVELKDITILKNEAKIEDGELVFQSDEIIKQFISYGIGVMFGRYSLDHDGLHIANMNENLEQVNLKFNIKNSKFTIDDDNIIPVLEDEYFDDDIASRFVEFVKVAFGDEHLKENVAFIEKSLGVSLRKYFVKGFYEDHIKRYKKRPIYWMVSSPKKGFMALMYMHRYQSDIFATVQNGYLREYIAKLEASELNHQREADDTSNSNAQRNRATKQVQKITKTLDEVIKFDREVLTSFAQNRVEIDLDDGVKVNYCRLKDILFPISGLCK